jgi:DNA polymerase-3 subunit gamma/tau
VVVRVPDPADLVDATTDELADLRRLADAAAAAAGGADLVTVLFDSRARAVDEAGRSTSPRLILEMAAVDLCQAEPLEPLGDLLERLEALEGRIQTGAPRPLPSPPAGRPGGERGGGVSAPAAAPPRTGATRDLSTAWKAVKASLAERRPRLGALLASAHLMESEGGRVTLGFRDRPDADAAERARGDLEQALAAELGSPVKLVVTQSAGAAPVIRAETAEEADALAADRRHREQEARQHPMVQKAQDLFGAPIREIKT